MNLASYQLLCIATYLPREGPETILYLLRKRNLTLYKNLSTSREAGNFCCVKFHFHFYFDRTTYSPREGPETVGHIQNVQHMKFGQV